MKTEVIRRPMSFRLRTDIMDIIRVKAAKANRTLNNYVESLLIEKAMEDEPNELTLEAIREAKENKATDKPAYSNVSEMMADLLSE